MVRIDLSATSLRHPSEIWARRTQPRQTLVACTSRIAARRSNSCASVTSRAAEGPRVHDDRDSDDQLRDCACAAQMMGLASRERRASRTIGAGSRAHVHSPYNRNLCVRTLFDMPRASMEDGVGDPSGRSLDAGMDWQVQGGTSRRRASQTRHLRLPQCYFSSKVTSVL